MDEELLTYYFDDNQCIDFLDDIEDFPFKKEEDAPKTTEGKQKFLIDLMWKLRLNPDRSFDLIPKCTSLFVFCMT